MGYESEYYSNNPPQDLFTALGARLVDGLLASVENNIRLRGFNVTYNGQQQSNHSGVTYP
jgi:hypothetical protein